MLLLLKNRKGTRGMLNHMRFVSKLNYFKVLFFFFLILSDLVGRTQKTQNQRTEERTFVINQIEVIKFCDIPGCQAVLH